jgi:hypothetical protein
MGGRRCFGRENISALEFMCGTWASSDVVVL